MWLAWAGKRNVVGLAVSFEAWVAWLGAAGGGDGELMLSGVWERRIVIESRIVALMSTFDFAIDPAMLDICE